MNAALAGVLILASFGSCDDIGRRPRRLNQYFARSLLQVSVCKPALDNGCFNKTRGTEWLSIGVVDMSHCDQRAEQTDQAVYYSASLHP